MIYAGTDLKFRVTATIEDFDIAVDDFSIVIRNRWGQTVATREWNDFLWDSDNNPYFHVEAQRGVYEAIFTARFLDDDYEDGMATFTDRQRLYVADMCGCDIWPDECGCSESAEHKVRYELVTVASGDFLMDVNGQYIVTSDGNYIVFGELKQKKERDMGKTRLSMTGEEFKELIEGRNNNEVIDTIPEMMQAAHGISDDTTIKEYVTDDLVGNLTDEDMEKWFDDDPTNDDPEDEENSSSDSSDGSSSE